MDWFLYDNGLRHERVKLSFFNVFTNYGVISSPYFRVLGLKIGKYGPEITVFGHFSRSVENCSDVKPHMNFSFSVLIISPTHRLVFVSMDLYLVSLSQSQLSQKS